MVLAGDARVILLDEPMAGVSMENVPELVELIRSVHARRQDGADGRAPHGGRHRTRAADRRAAPRGLLAVDTPDGDHAERDRAAGLPRGADLMALVEVRDLHVRIGESHILQGIEFDVAEGGVTALLGRNGVGKTTTLRALMGLVDRAGLVRYDGADITHMPTHKIVRRGVGYVPEDRDVFAALTVDENLRLAERERRAALRPRLRPLPGAEGTRQAARRHAFRRAAADGRDRARAAERQPRAPRRRADEGALAAARLRGRARARACVRADDGPARRAEPRRRRAGRARRRRARHRPRRAHRPSAGAPRRQGDGAANAGCRSCTR